MDGVVDKVGFKNLFESLVHVIDGSKAPKNLTANLKILKILYGRTVEVEEDSEEDI